MKFDRFRVLFFTLLGISMAALLGSLAYLCFASRAAAHTGAKTLMVIVTAAMGIAALVNVTCGIQHRKRWGRGGLRSYGEGARIFFLIDLAVFSLGGLFMLVMAVKFWLLPS